MAFYIQNNKGQSYCGITLYKKKKKLQTKRFTFIFIVSSQSYAVHEKVSIQLLFPSTLPITKVLFGEAICSTAWLKSGDTAGRGSKSTIKGLYWSFLVCMCAF